MVAVTGALVALSAVKEAILPAPLAAKPIEGVLLVQLNTVPGTGPLKLIAAVAALLQTVWFETGFTVGIALMVTVNVQLAVLPDASVAVPVTVVVPTGKTLPDAGVNTTVTPGQLSVAVCGP